LVPIRRIIIDASYFGFINYFYQIYSSTPENYLFAVASINRLLLYVSLVIILAGNNNSKEIYKKLFCGIAAGTVFSIILGLFEYFNIISIDWYVPKVKKTVLHSTFLNRGWFAEYVICTISYVICFLYSFSKSKVNHAILFLVFVLCVASLWLTNARTPLVVLPGLIIISIIFLLRSSVIKNGFASHRGKTILIISTALAFTILAPIIYTAANYVINSTNKPKAQEKNIDVIQFLENQGKKYLRTGRLETWNESIVLAMESPIFGMGYGTYAWHGNNFLKIKQSPFVRSHEPGRYIRDTPHNLYLTIFLFNGVWGLAVWVLLVSTVVFKLFKDFQNNYNLISLSCLLSIIGFHLYGFTQSMQYVPMIWMLVFLNLGYAMTIDANVGSEKKTLPFINKKYLMFLLLIVVFFHYAYNFESDGIKKKYKLGRYNRNFSGPMYFGFYKPENWSGVTYQWTGNKAKIVLEKNGLIEFNVACYHSKLLDNPVHVELRLNGAFLEDIIFKQPGKIKKEYSINSNNRPLQLQISVSRTWNPYLEKIFADKRWLGVAVGPIKYLQTY